jgi:hypothetical protein
LPSVLTGSFKAGNHVADSIFRFLPEIIRQQMGNLSEMKRFELKYFMQGMEHSTVRNRESLSNRSRGVTATFPIDAQNGGGNIVEGRPSGAMLVMEAFPSSADLRDPE